MTLCHVKIYPLFSFPKETKTCIFGKTARVQKKEAKATEMVFYGDLPLFVESMIHKRDICCDKLKDFKIGKLDEILEMNELPIFLLRFN